MAAEESDGGQSHAGPAALVAPAVLPELRADVVRGDAAGGAPQQDPIGESPAGEVQASVLWGVRGGVTS